jgi:hypothetical protein
MFNLLKETAMPATEKPVAKKATSPAKPPVAKVAAPATPKAVASRASGGAKTAATAKKTAPRAGTRTGLDGERRQHYVEVAAYFIAERRGFMNGCAQEDWFAAEGEIDRLIREGKLAA